MDIMGIMKKAQAMQSKLADMQTELETVVVEGKSGGGMVVIGMTARGVLKSVSIDPALLKPEEREMVEDLIVAAHEEARRKAEEATQEKMKTVTDGMPLPPGMKLPV